MYFIEGETFVEVVPGFHKWVVGAGVKPPPQHTFPNNCMKVVSSVFLINSFFFFCTLHAVFFAKQKIPYQICLFAALKLTGISNS